MNELLKKMVKGGEREREREREKRRNLSVPIYFDIITIDSISVLRLSSKFGVSCGCGEKHLPGRIQIIRNSCCQWLPDTWSLLAPISINKWCGFVFFIFFFFFFFLFFFRVGVSRKGLRPLIALRTTKSTSNTIFNH